MADKLDTLKQKYQSVLSLIQQSQAHLQNVHMVGEKLYIKAEAPSSDVKNKIWDQIKLIDSKYSDLTADITVSQQQQQQPTMTAGASAAGGQSTRRYTVKPGDTLSKISREFYGDANQYMRIFEANRDRLRDPDKIQAGQELMIPEG